MVKSKRYFLITFVLVFVIGIPAFCNDIGHKKIKDVLNLNNEMDIVITKISYEKIETSKSQLKDEIVMTREDLKELFLAKAVTISGTEINYNFDYERVWIFGLINNNDKTYNFNYNLAGFGFIFVDDNKFIEFGDMSKSISEQ